MSKNFSLEWKTLIEEHLEWLSENGLIREKGTQKRRSFLMRLLARIPLHGLSSLSYRMAVDAELDDHSNLDHPFLQEVAREFYAFALGIREMPRKGGISNNPKEVVCRFSSLDDWYDHISTLDMTIEEILILNAYKQGLQKACKSEIVVNSHFKMARSFALAFLRDCYPKMGSIYRRRVQEAISLIEPSQHDFFLQVIREYYRYWLRDPDADEMFESFFMDRSS